MIRTTILFDTETTGLLKPKALSVSEQPYIAEIYCLKIEESAEGMKELGEFETYLKPPIPLSDEITKITGITNEMIAKAPAFSEKWRALAEFFKGTDRLVAHNLSFDRSMLANELVRISKVLNFPWPIEHVCTVERTLHIEQRRMNLTRLHEHLFNEGFPDAHRARIDVEALTRCYIELRKTGVIK